MNNLNVSFLILLFSVMAGYNCRVRADVKTARIFGSDMVMQEGIENPVWGWAEKKETITVSLAGKTVKTKADSDGKWMVKLPSMDYGGPYSMTIKGKKDIIEFTNVMVGEVWFCSGQSNMEFPVNRVINANEEMANADYPDIRLFTVPKKIAQYPLSDLQKGEWTVCSPQTIPNFSAVGYFFGREIQQEMNVAVGLIHSSWGGTNAEAWTSPATIEKNADLSGKLEELQKIDFANYGKTEKEKIKKKLGAFPTGYDGLKRGYNQWNFDDSAWKTVYAPRFWEEQGYENMDGVAWYRKAFELTEEQASQELTLYLAKIDDKDICWVNGVEVGTTTMRSLDRIYKVPPTALRAGKNIIAIRITDERDNGGIYGNPEDVFAKSGKSKINLSGEWKIKFTQVKGPLFEIRPNDYPTQLFNAMVHPVLPYGIKGIIWYQGEANVPRAKQYREVFSNMIIDWRNHWGKDDLPFLWVQLANYLKPAEQPRESDWAELREAQAMALKLPYTGMASAIDIGEAEDIHPGNKQDVGKRLALNALKIAYNHDVVCSGPTYKSMRIEGQKVYISFDNIPNGWKVNNKYGYVNGFSVAGDDKKFYWAKAEVLSDNTIVLYSGKVLHPVAVRYAWSNNPGDLNLYNKENLPANPFRTDSWENNPKK